MNREPKYKPGDFYQDQFGYLNVITDVKFDENIDEYVVKSVNFFTSDFGGISSVDVNTNIPLLAVMCKEYFIPYTPSDEERAFFLMQLENYYSNLP